MGYSGVYGGYGAGVYGLGGYGLGYGGYGLGYGGYRGYSHFGKRSADAEPTAAADAKPYYPYSGVYGGYGAGVYGLGVYGLGYGGYGLGYGGYRGYSHFGKRSAD